MSINTISTPEEYPTLTHCFPVAVNLEIHHNGQPVYIAAPDGEMEIRIENDARSLIIHHNGEIGQIAQIAPASTPEPGWFRRLIQNIDEYLAARTCRRKRYAGLNGGGQDD